MLLLQLLLLLLLLGTDARLLLLNGAKRQITEKSQLHTRDLKVASRERAIRLRLLEQDA